MQDRSVFSFEDYKKYLAAVLSPTGQGRGLRTRLAQEIGVQTAFVSQVLKQKVHFSLEHALKISRFLHHSESEAHFFMLLVELGRAGSGDLKKYFKTQMEQIQAKRTQIAERLQVKSNLQMEDQLIYYSAWYYGAIHVLLSIPAMQTRQSLSQFLHLDIERVSDCLDFLCRCGLARENEGRFEIGNARIHLPANSPLISKHHTNWRIRALQALENNSSGKNLHYSSAITLAKADVVKIRTLVLDAIERAESIYRPSREEVAYVFNMDFFPL